MDDQVFLAWNLPNWITVVLMVALGYLVVSLVYQLLLRRGLVSGGAGANDNYPGQSLIFGNASVAGYAG